MNGRLTTSKSGELVFTAIIKQTNLIRSLCSAWPKCSDSKQALWNKRQPWTRWKMLTGLHLVQCEYCSCIKRQMSKHAGTLRCQAHEQQTRALDNTTAIYTLPSTVKHAFSPDNELSISRTQQSRTVHGHESKHRTSSESFLPVPVKTQSQNRPG